MRRLCSPRAGWPAPMFHKEIKMRVVLPLIVLLMSFASCYKTYTCQCWKYTDRLQTDKKPYVAKIRAQKVRNAHALCKAQGDNVFINEDDFFDCELK